MHNKNNPIIQWCCLLAGVLIRSRAVADPTAEHHGEDHLKDLNRTNNRTSLIQYVSNPAPGFLSQLIEAGVQKTAESCGKYTSLIYTHHDDSHHQRGQTNQVELLGEQLGQFDVTALLGDRRGDVVINDVIRYHIIISLGLVEVVWVVMVLYTRVCELNPAATGNKTL